MEPARRSARRGRGLLGANPGPDPGPGRDLRLCLFRPDRPPRGRLYLPRRLRLAVGRSARNPAYLPVVPGSNDDGSGDYCLGPDGAGGQSIRTFGEPATAKSCSWRGGRVARVFAPAFAAGRHAVGPRPEHAARVVGNRAAPSGNLPRLAVGGRTALHGGLVVRRRHADHGGRLPHRRPHLPAHNPLAVGNVYLRHRGGHAGRRRRAALGLARQNLGQPGNAHGHPDPVCDRDEALSRTRPGKPLGLGRPDRHGRDARDRAGSLRARDATACLRAHRWRASPLAAR